MHRVVLRAMAVGVLFLATVAAPPVSAEPSQAVLQEIREKADAAFKASEKPKPPKTPEQIAAEKKSIKSHCDGVFARAAERGSTLPGNCD